jgi:putative PIN family toxin of toxin-antitoxin system
MKVVFDTVVLVRSLLDPYGRSGKLIFDLAGTYEWVVSPEIVAEYLEVLHRPRLMEKYRTVATRDLMAILSRIGAATLVHPPPHPSVSRDPTDDKFLAAAQTGGVRFIVSEDHDLLAIAGIGTVEIVNTEAFLRIIEPAGRK